MFGELAHYGSGPSYVPIKIMVCLVVGGNWGFDIYSVILQNIGPLFLRHFEAHQVLDSFGPIPLLIYVLAGHNIDRCITLLVHQFIQICSAMYFSFQIHQSQQAFTLEIPCSKDEHTQRMML